MYMSNNVIDGSDNSLCSKGGIPPGGPQGGGGQMQPHSGGPGGMPEGNPQMVAPQQSQQAQPQMGGHEYQQHMPQPHQIQQQPNPASLEMIQKVNKNRF